MNKNNKIIVSDDYRRRNSYLTMKYIFILLLILKQTVKSSLSDDILSIESKNIENLKGIEIILRYMYYFFVQKN